MEFKEYQEKAKETAVYPKVGYNWVYPSFGLAGKVGEVLEKLKKVMRNDQGIITEEEKSNLEKEIGDVLWYLSMLTTELELSLDEIAKKNLEKLQLRKERGVIHSQVDNR